MQYLSELPEIDSISVNRDLIELELKSRVEKLTEANDNDPIILCARSSGQMVVAVGYIISHDDIEGPEPWSRIGIKGALVEFTSEMPDNRS